MGHCDPKEVRKGRPWYMTVHDPLPVPPHVQAARDLEELKAKESRNGKT